MFANPLYRNLFSTEEMRSIWSFRTMLSSWIKVEQALAAAQGDMGLIPTGAAAALSTVTSKDINVDLLVERLVVVGRPIVGLVEQLREKVGEQYAEFVHFRTTTQDIMDTATILQVRGGLHYTVQMLKEIVAQLEALAQRYRHTPMIGRTNGQYAKKISFGKKIDLWHSELTRRLEVIEEASRRGLRVQLGGPVGNINGDDESTVLKLRNHVAGQLGLTSSIHAWQNNRDCIGDIVLSIAQLCTSLEKIAHNINLLSSSDIGELYEEHTSGKGTSSSMAHKRNQRCSEFAEALGRLTRGAALQICGVSKHEHERSGGAWISEWAIIPETFLYASGTLKWTYLLFSTLQVDEARMLENLETAEQSIELRLSNR